MTLSTDLPSPLGGMNTTGMESMVTFLVFSWSRFFYHPNSYESTPGFGDQESRGRYVFFNRYILYPFFLMQGF